MRVGFSRFKRKLTDVKIRSLSRDGTIYFMDDQDRIIGRLYAGNIITLFVSDEKGNIHTFNLAYSFKYKCGQDVIVADVAFTSLNNDNTLPVVSKNRAIKYEKDNFMPGYETATCGTIRSENNALHVNIPMLNVEDSLTEVISEISGNTVFYHLTTRTVK